MACFSASEIENFVSADENRIMGDIATFTARRSPYTDIMEDGVLENEAGSSFRAILQNRVKVAASLTKPVFTDVRNMCNQAGGTDKTGTTEYPYNEEMLRGQSEPICLNQAKQAFKTSYKRVTESIKQGFVKLKDADIRYQLFALSGVKANVIEGVNVNTTFQGDIGDISTDFLPTLPNAFITFKYVKNLVNFMNDNLFAEPWEPNGVVAKLIGSRDMVDRLRDEVDFRADLRALTTGRYKLGEEGIDSYEFDGPYRGIVFGVDNQALRASLEGGGAQVPGLEAVGLELVEPEIEVATTNGVKAAVNPNWVNALYEFAFLAFKGGFRYMASKQWTGDGDVDFPFALAPSTLKFKTLQDAGCYVWGDTGIFLYNISRGIRPEIPTNVATIIYRRCNADMGLAECNTSGNLI